MTHCTKKKKKQIIPLTIARFGYEEYYYTHATTSIILKTISSAYNLNKVSVCKVPRLTKFFQSAYVSRATIY